MTVVANKEVIATYTLVIPGGETAKVTIDIQGRPSVLEIAFNDDANEQSVTILGVGAYDARLLFHKWDNPLGTALTTPYQLTRDQFGALYMMAVNYRIGQTNHFTIQFLKDRGPL